MAGSLLGEGGILSFIKLLPCSPALEVGVLRPPYRWKSSGPGRQNGLALRLQLVGQVLCFEFTAFSTTHPSLGQQMDEGCSEKSSLLFF